MSEDQRENIGLFEVLYSARALRRFKPDPIPDEVLFQLFDAAIRAPSGTNAQDWRYVVITDPALKQTIQGWFWEAWQRYQPRYAADPAQMDALPRPQRLSLKSTDYLVRHLADVPAIVVVCSLRGRHSTPGGSIFPAVQNLLLAARALGLGGSITNFARGHAADLSAMLHIPDDNEIVCLVPIGYPLDRQGPLRRKPVKRVVFLNGWGESWPFAEQQPDAGWTDRWLPDR